VGVPGEQHLLVLPVHLTAALQPPDQRIIIIFFFPTIAATHEVVGYGGVYSLKSIRLY
jgi:hypothetical protein